MMEISLSKGERINLSKNKLKKVRLAINWEVNKTSSGSQYDLDCSAFVCQYDSQSNPKLISAKHMIFYNIPQLDDGSVIHSGDDRTGGTGEVINVDLEKMASNVDEISFVVTIHEATERRQNFGQIPHSSITLINEETGDTLAKFALEHEFSSETAIQFGSLYKYNGEWLFKAVGTGYNLGLAEFVTEYGGNPK